MKVCNLIKKSHGRSEAFNVIIRRCLKFLAKVWEVEVSHIFSEINGVADGLLTYLCKCVLRRKVGYYLLHEPPHCVRGMLEADARGVTHQRWVLVVLCSKDLT